MYFDALTMSATADELQERLGGGRVQSVVQMDRLTLGWEVYVPPRRHVLVMSAHPQFARVHLSTQKARRGTDTASPLLLLMRKYARDARITAIEQVPYERILCIDLSHPEHGETTLVLEIMGRHSNIILVSPDNVVMESIKRVGADVNRYRVVQPRAPYVPPPPQDKVEVQTLSAQTLGELLRAAPRGETVWRALVNGVRAISPLLARELAFRAYGDAQIVVEDVGLVQPLLEQIRQFLVRSAGGAWEPCVVQREEEVTAFAPYALRHMGDYTPVSSISAAVEAYVAAQTSRDPYAAARAQVRALIAEARRQLARKRHSLERALEPAENLDELRRWGEAILACAHQIERGQDRLRVEWEPGAPLDIPLAPELSPAENAAAYFERYHHAKRAAGEIPPLLEELSLAERHLDQLEADLDMADNQPEIQEVRAALEQAGYIKMSRPRPQRAHSQPLTRRSIDGFTILVGKNSRQNEEVTFRRAAGNDVWLHARGVPGAHVIIRSGGRTVPERTLREAAQLAAYFSSARNDGRVPVDYTEQRHVRRIKGAAPGLVNYSRETTLYVAPKGPRRDSELTRR